MKILVGLGNPGASYANNRHNVGFMALHHIAKDYAFPAWKAKFSGEISDKIIDGTKVMLLKPKTFMNLSGNSVGQALNFYKIFPKNIIVFHDELDLSAGKLRVKTGGGHAGHNGLRSLDKHIGKNYQRVRIGIGHPGDKNRVNNYVLHDFTKSDNIWRNLLLQAISDELNTLIRGDAVRFQSDVAQTMQAKKALSAATSNIVTKKSPLKYLLKKLKL